MRLMFLIIFLILGSLFSYRYINCITPQDYINSVNDSKGNYIRDKNFNTLNFTVQYTPEPFLAIKSLGLENLNKLNYSETLDGYNYSKNFILQISKKNSKVDVLQSLSTNEASYQELINYLSFDIYKDLFLCIDKDTIHCTYAHFERAFNLAPFARVQFGFKLDHEAFKNINKCKSVSILFDASHFRYGDIIFRFDEELMLEKPCLKF